MNEQIDRTIRHNSGLERSRSFGYQTRKASSRERIFAGLMAQARTPTSMRYHDSAIFVAIAHFSLVNCVKNAEHTPFTSTYFALLTNLKYKRMYDDPEHSTNILFYLKFVSSAWPYTFDRCQKRFLYVSYATNARNGDANT